MTYPLKHVRARYPDLSIDYLAMTHAECNLKLCTVTKNKSK